MMASNVATATPASSANYIEQGMQNQHHSYNFEQSTKVLLDSTWDVRYTDNRFRAFPVRYSSFKHEPRWATIFDDWGKRFGVAVLVDVRNKILITAWADEFKTGGLHYVNTSILHEKQRFGWESLIASSTTKRLEHEHQVKLIKQQAETQRALAFDNELTVHKRKLEDQFRENERKRDTALFQSVQNLEADYELRRTRLESEYNLKRLELAELRQIQNAKYAQDSEALQEFFDQKVSKQNARVAQTLLNLQGQYESDLSQLELERNDLKALKSRLTLLKNKYQTELSQASISKSSYDELVKKLASDSKSIREKEEQLAKREEELEAKYLARNKSIDKEIEKRSKALTADISNLKSKMKLAQSNRLKELNAEHSDRMAVLSKREAELNQQEKEVAELRQKYFPEFDREILPGNGETRTTGYVDRYWRYELYWDDRYLTNEQKSKLLIRQPLKFTGTSFESDLTKIICHIGETARDIAISSQLYPKDNFVTIRFDVVDSAERQKFLKKCNY